MHAIDVDFDSRASLRDALLDTFSEGGIFIEGNYDVTSGSPILVRVGVSGLRAGSFLEGIVQWRRVGAARTPDMVAGLGVRMLANQRDRFAFLQRWAIGSHDASGRLDWRYPYDMKVFLSTRGRGTGRVLHATVRDVSERGVMLAMPTKIASGTPLAMEFARGNDAVLLAGTLAWSDDGRAGLVFDFEKSDDHAAWHRVVDEAVQQFSDQIAPRRRLTDRPSIRG